MKFKKFLYDFDVFRKCNTFYHKFLSVLEEYE